MTRPIFSQQRDKSISKLRRAINIQQTSGLQHSRGLRNVYYNYIPLFLNTLQIIVNVEFPTTYMVLSLPLWSYETEFREILSFKGPTWKGKLYWAMGCAEEVSDNSIKLHYNDPRGQNKSFRAQIKIEMFLFDLPWNTEIFMNNSMCLKRSYDSNVSFNGVNADLVPLFFKFFNFLVTTLLDAESLGLREL